MSEETTAQAGAENQPAGGSESKTFSQDEVNKIVKERVAKEKAKYSNFEKFKADSEELAKIQEADKTEIERAKDRASKAEKERDALLNEKNLATWKEQAAKDYGVPADILRGSNEDEIIAHAKQLEQFFTQQPTPVVNSDGRTPAKTTPSTASLFARAINQAKK